jgi:lauroyl/myristoyl acyltransferase
MIIYHLAEFGRSTVCKLPTGIIYPLAAGIGDGMYYFWSRARRNMIKSVAAVLNSEVDDPEVRKIARRGMRNYCKYVVDMLTYSRPKDEFFQTQCRLQGREYLDAALKEGKGAILVSFHLGNLDLGIKLLSSLGYPVNAIVDNLEWSGQLNTFLQKGRSQNGAKLIDSRDVSSQLLAVLRRNEALALMIDCPNFGKGIKIKLGQKWVRVPTGAATLALRTGAKIIPCGLVRTSNNTFQGILGQPLECQPGGKIAKDTQKLTQDMVKALEDMTRAFIDQW